jgi:hypothetical protein
MCYYSKALVILMAYGVKGMFLTILASFFLIIMGLLYFMFTLWIVKVGASFILPEMWKSGSINGGFVVLAAALMSAGSMMASSMQKH